MENDIYGAQKKVWKLIRRTKKEINELVTKNKITMDEGEKFFHELYRSTREDPEEPTPDIRGDNHIQGGYRKRAKNTEEQEISRS